MACNCKNKLNNYIDVSKINQQDWQEIDSLIAMDECGNIVIAQKPDTLVKEDRKKVNSIRLKGKGKKALYDNGEYQETYTAGETDKKLQNYPTKKEIDKKLKKLEDYYTKEETDNNLSASLEDYYTKQESDSNLSSALEQHYTKQEIDSNLENAVFYDKNNNILLREQNKITAKQSSEQQKKIFNVIDTSKWDNIDLGSDQVKFNIKSKSRPTVQLHGDENTNTIAFLEEIEKKENNLQTQLNSLNKDILNQENKLGLFKSDIDESLNDFDQRISTNTQNIADNKAEIKNLRDDFNAAEHFKGYFETYLEIQEIPGEQGAFAWCAQTGTVWTYNFELKTWQDSENTIPDQTVKAYDGYPRMDGEAEAGTSNQYARGDHKHPSDSNKADKEEFHTLNQDFSQHIQQYNSFKEESNLSLDSVNQNIADLQNKTAENTQNITENTVDIQTLRDDFNAAEHFKGYFETYLEIQDIPGEQGAFAWCAQTGTVWIYNFQLKTWQDSENPVPDQTVFAYDAYPVMDGKPEAGSSTLYARGDHRHPSDKNKADKTDLDNYLPLKGNTQENQMTGDIWLGTKNKILITDSGNSYLAQEENTQTTILRGFGGGGIDIQTQTGELKYNGIKIATIDDLLPAEDKAKIDILKTDGNGDQYLTDNGTYKKITELDDFYLPLTGGTLTGSLGITNPETENIFNIDVSDKGTVYLDSESPLQIISENPEKGTISTITLEDGAIITKGDIIPNPYSNNNLGQSTSQFNEAYIKHLYLDNKNKTQQINAIDIEGDGTKFLGDDGNYHEIDIDTSNFIQNGEQDRNIDIHLNNDHSFGILDAADMNLSADSKISMYAHGQNGHIYLNANKYLSLATNTNRFTMAENNISIETAEKFYYNNNEVATKNDIITTTEGEGTKFLSDDGTYQEVVTDVPGFTEDNPARDLYLEGSGSIFFGNPNEEYFAEIHNDDGVTITQRNFISLDAPNVYINDKEIATKNDLPEIDKFVINGKNQKDLEISAPSISLLSYSNTIDLYDENVSIAGTDSIYLSTHTGKVLYNNNEVATVNDIITKTDGDGNSFLANNGEYKQIKNLTGSDVISTTNDKIDIIIDESDKVISKDKAGLKVNIDIAINGNTITLYGKDREIINTIELTQSQIIENAYIDADTNELVIVFITDDGTKEVRADLSQLITPYLAGSYITLNGEDNNIINVDYSSLKSQLINDGFGTNYVTTDTDQTITGIKTFNQALFISNDNGVIGLDSEGNDFILISATHLNTVNLGGSPSRNYPVQLYCTPPEDVTSPESILVPNCGWVNKRISKETENFVSLEKNETITGKKTFRYTPTCVQNYDIQTNLESNWTRGLNFLSTTGTILGTFGLYSNGDTPQYLHIGCNTTGSAFNDSQNMLIYPSGNIAVGGALHPKTTNTQTLGLADRYWANTYTTGLTVGTAGINCNGNMSIAGTLTPATSGTQALGNTNYKWNVYATTTDTNNLTVNSTSTFTGMLTANGGVIVSNGGNGIRGLDTKGIQQILISIDSANDVLLGGGVSDGRPVRMFHTEPNTSAESTSETSKIVPNIGWVNTRLNTVLTGANILSKLNDLPEINFTKHLVCSAGAGTVSTSDIRFKKNIKPLENSLETIENLDLFHYDWEQEDGTLLENQIGLSAQQLEASYPELVHQMQDKRQTRTVDYSRLVIPALKAIQELSAKINTLEAELAELKKQPNA